ncbi:MAG: hypothetical protein V3V08_15420 [Nannocystaceae bacterium]
MRVEFEEAGVDVQLVAVNGDDAADDQAKLYERCSFPIFQDVNVSPSDNVWQLHGGGKDDMYIYGREGHLAAYLPADGPASINLSTDEGYAFVKQSILDAVGP